MNLEGAWQQLGQNPARGQQPARLGPHLGPHLAPRLPQASSFSLQEGRLAGLAGGVSPPPSTRNTHFTFPPSPSLTWVPSLEPCELWALAAPPHLYSFWILSYLHPHSLLHLDLPWTWTAGPPDPPPVEPCPSCGQNNTTLWGTEVPPVKMSQRAEGRLGLGASSHLAGQRSAAERPSLSGEPHGCVSLPWAQHGPGLWGAFQSTAASLVFGNSHDPASAGQSASQEARPSAGEVSSFLGVGPSSPEPCPVSPPWAPPALTAVSTGPSGVDSSLEGKPNVLICMAFVCPTCLGCKVPWQPCPCSLSPRLSGGVPGKGGQALGGQVGTGKRWPAGASSWVPCCAAVADKGRRASSRGLDPGIHWNSLGHKLGEDQRGLLRRTLEAERMSPGITRPWLCVSAGGALTLLWYWMCGPWGPWSPSAQ